MTRTLFTLIRDAGRVALYSFVLGPALVLYVFVMLAASDGSLSRQFLTTFHNLTDGVPAGKVIACVNPAPTLEKAPPEVLCQRGYVDSDAWTHSVDATLRKAWMVAVIFGFGWWFVFRGLSLAAQRRISPDKHSYLTLEKKEKHE
ncbi:hypothetical protein VC623_22860 [Citrobacter amalonaticus]|uniref:hypothetical protein n=1 Tax=Citrobacter amalonaticus TaxID=35703 RepID=UPI00292B786D|nr:hypothetical protein [Citrobacter amalonaticus]EDV0839724.1 hypothetical protein [Salmonella enterica subsp. enterica serovar Havana]EDV6712231.1 hypothetical protein [Salmonella enterica subsp. enterica serovar Havana]MDV0787451.1 hypothetical protein [Citrobacter amalonaticus]MEB0643515.1 hypothetical protein [Citrobacter amalonaticus]